MEKQKNEMVQIFNNEEFGRMRTVTIDDEPWFVGKDVAEILGYANPSKALADHVDKEDKLNNESLSSLGQRGGWLINESGLYTLIFGSKLESAKRFKHWVTSEVLPTLRKTGTYTMENMTANQKIQLLLQGNLETNERIDKVDHEIAEIKKRLDIVSAPGNDWALKKIQDATKSQVYRIANTSVYKTLWSHYFFAGINTTLRNHYSVSSIKSIPTDKTEEAIEIIRKWHPIDSFVYTRVEEMKSKQEKNLLPDKKVIALLQYLAETNNGNTNPFK